MTTTATVRPITATSYLSPGTAIRFQGKNYRIDKVNKVNYRIVGENGKSYNLNRHAPIEVIKADEFKAPAEASDSKSVYDFASGQRVRYTGNGDLSGKEGLVFQLNQTTCGVVFENVGSYRVSPGLIEQA